MQSIGIDIKWCEVLWAMSKFLSISYVAIRRAHQFHFVLDLVSNLQRVLNAVAKLIFGGKTFHNVKPLMCDKLHWLKVSERFIYNCAYVRIRPSTATHRGI